MILCFEKPNFEHYVEKLSSFGVANHIVITPEGDFEKDWDHDQVERFLENDDADVYVVTDEPLHTEILSMDRYKLYDKGEEYRGMHSGENIKDLEDQCYNDSPTD